jgi:ribosome maturation factor RimP
MGFAPIFCLWRHMDLNGLLERTLEGLGYEVVDLERSNHGRLLRVFIDREGGVTVDDCAHVSNHLTRLFAVENVEYDRLEVSSPGMDRPLKKAADFARFAGETAKVHIRVPIEGQRNFTGVIRGVADGVIELDVGGKAMHLELSNVDKARLVPEYEVGPGARRRAGGH